MKIGIINYGVGNLASVENALKFVAKRIEFDIESKFNSNSIKIAQNAECSDILSDKIKEQRIKKIEKIEISIIENPQDLSSCQKAILPGVGAFGDGMKLLKKRGFISAIGEFCANENKNKRGLLGICLGMQLLFEKSEEFGEHEGLGLLKGSVIKFRQENLKKGEKIPHIGWNLVRTQGLYGNSDSMKNKVDSIESGKIDSIKSRANSSHSADGIESGIKSCKIESGIKSCKKIFIESRISNIESDIESSQIDSMKKNKVDSIESGIESSQIDSIKKAAHPLFYGLPSEFYLYFVHSFCVRQMQNAIGVCDYGGDFAAIVAKDNICGIQAHPEKSHAIGLKILENFLLM